VYGHYSTPGEVRSQVNFTSYADCGVGLAVDLVNSYSPTSQREHLTDVGALQAFLREQKDSYGRPVTQHDLEQVRVVRERLREVFLAPEEGTAVSILNALLAESGALPQLTDHDGEAWHLHYTPPETPLARRWAAEAAMGLAVIIEEHGFERLRVCEGKDCLDVFVDVSRNRSRRYCSPEVCGNRANVAAYRARKRVGVGAEDA
jgi:predicted RNA-binding Zn ribbon-like protein